MSYQPPGPEVLRALETAPNMYLILSPDLIILTASDLYLTATQNKREWIAGKHIFEAFPDNPNLPDGDGVQNINASLQEVLRTKKPHYMRIQRYDVPDIENPGQFIQRYWDPSHTPVFNEDGTIHYIIQLATNVTDKVLADKALSKQIRINKELENSEQHFRRLADMLPAKISNALPTGEVTFFNKQWLDYAGMSFEDLRDFGYYQMMHPDEIQTFQMQLEEAAAKGVALESELRFKDINGYYRWHLNVASPVLNADGEIIMWVGATIDIQRIKEEEQRKDDFIGMVSHELKTPLTSLSAYLQLVKLKSNEDVLAADMLGKANKQVSKMTNLINGFLNVSRFESGKIHIDKQRFDMAMLVREAEKEVLSLYNTHRIQFAPVEETFVNADKDKIGQVINNLISNAVKYSPSHTLINVACINDGGVATVSVRDEGIGIREEDQSKLFDRYYRVNNNAETSVAGFGIGLYLCYEIINHHHGKIWVESEVGKGSIFYFSLPVSE